MFLIKNRLTENFVPGSCAPEVAADVDTYFCASLKHARVYVNLKEAQNGLRSWKNISWYFLKKSGLDVDMSSMYTIVPVKYSE